MFNSLFKVNNSDSQKGQTLIETVVAVFIMIMGIVSALGLAIYSLNASSNISKQIIAVGLAREGVEVVKNMRDTNWLKDTLSTTCYDYPSVTKSASCYEGWLNPARGTDFGLASPSDLKDYSINFDGTSSLLWELNPASVPQNIEFGLNYDPAAENGFYYSVTAEKSNSDFYRKITIEKIVDYAPYDFGNPAYNYPLLIVTSQVWWKDKGCPVIENEEAPPSYDDVQNTKCLITLKMYLTNWKNY